MNICPQPNHWHEIHKRLTAICSERGLAPPPVPLILNGWVYTNDMQKAARWNATVQWANEHGLSEMVEVPAGGWHSVEEPTSYDIGPMYGPMYLPWRSELAGVPSQQQTDEAFTRLQQNWNMIAGELAAHTKPAHISGEKKRRLVVTVTKGAPTPPWGTWHSLAHDASRREFTEFRKRLNAVASPLEFDHVDFQDESGNPFNAED